MQSHELPSNVRSFEDLRAITNSLLETVPARVNWIVAAGIIIGNIPVLGLFELLERKWRPLTERVYERKLAETVRFPGGGIKLAMVLSRGKAHPAEARFVEIYPPGATVGRNYMIEYLQFTPEGPMLCTSIAFGFDLIEVRRRDAPPEVIPVYSSVVQALLAQQSTLHPTWRVG